jgi:hypothetical protein
MKSTDLDLLLSWQFAHDLRSPMSALLILVTDLRQRVEFGEGGPDPETLAMMEEALLAMDAMLMGLVSIASRGAEGEGGAEPEPFSLRDTLSRVEALLAPWNRVRGGRFVWQVQGEDLRLGHPEPLAHLLFLLLVAGPDHGSGNVTTLEVGPCQGADDEEVLVRIRPPGPFPASETLNHLQEVVAGKLPRTRQCQAYLPLEGALWLARALGARVSALSDASGTDELRIALALPMSSHAV